MYLGLGRLGNGAPRAARGALSDACICGAFVSTALEKGRVKGFTANVVTGASLLTKAYTDSTSYVNSAES